MILLDQLLATTVLNITHGWKDIMKIWTWKIKKIIFKIVILQDSENIFYVKE